MAKKNPDLDIDIGRLAAAMQRSRLVLRTPRQHRFDAVREYVGRRWSEEGALRSVPCNLISAYCGIVGRKLIAHNPRVMLSTWSRKARPTVKAMEQWANKEIEKICLVDTLKECVLDGLFSIGICKVALASPADAALMGWRLKAGTPYAEPIDLDDFVFDIHAKKMRECGFMGHRYRVPLSVIKSSKLYSKSRKDLTPEWDRIYNMEGDERIGILGRTTLGGDQEEFEDFVDLWEVYLPRHKVIITLRDDNLTGAASGGDVKADPHYGKALRIQRWLGPECGPYHIWAARGVPGNPMPKGPIQDLYDLHCSINNILRKLLRQAERQKEVVFVAGGADEDGERLIKTDDGEATRCDNPDKLKQVMWGGPNQQNYMLFEAMKQLFSWLAGNLDVMGGLSPQGDTATQEKLLNANSSATIDEMQQTTLDFTSSVIGALTWYWHHHPQQVMRSEYQAPGLQGMSVTRKIHPAGQGRDAMGRPRLARDHSYEDMDIKVDPYSMPHLTPQQRVGMLQQLVTQVYLPMSQLAQQQGISLDLNAFFEKWGHLNDFPDIQDLLTIQEPPQQEAAGGPSDAAGPKPAETTRNYVRRSQGPQQGGMNSLLQHLQATGGKQNGRPQNGQGAMPGGR